MQNEENERVPAIDWPHIVRELRKNGVSQATLAKNAGRAQSQISRLALGQVKEPCFAVGVAVLRSAQTANIPTLPLQIVLLPRVAAR